ncbi:uncharacterized protein LOC143245365 isoform X4 [Tachypleus tridentatus]|uniref:uncharacterized protein LOC143245365 isoform X4 n=1 Tax=Tachypleus tridentatus TaxID=6853 RepID=UPI003FD5B9C1
MKMISGEDFCTLNNLHKTTEFSNVHSFVLLSATDHIRFRANSSWLWWNKWEAMKYTLLIYSAWNMSDSGISTKWPCSPHPSVAQNLSLFSLEYKDCSGRKITHKPVLVDSCGVCGGDGTSCRLSNDSGKDCLRCGMDTTGNVIQPDCAGSCEQSNVLVTLGKNKVCIRKQDEHTITLCDGSKNSSAVNNRCGHCVGGNTNRSLNYDIDICNVCGGKNECVGCDGIPFSGTTLNEYGQCQNQTELETINSFSFMKFYVKRGTYFLTTWKPNSFCYAFVSKRNMNQQIEIEFRVRNSGKTLYSFNSLLTKVTSFLLIRFVRTDVFSDCHPFPSDMYFWPSTNVTIECHIYNDSSKSEFLFVEKTFKFTQLDCRKNYVAKITPTTVYNNKSTELTAEVKNISSTSFKCAHVSRSLSFFISSENSALTEHSTVRCHFPQIFQCQDYKLLLLDESWTKDDEPHLDIIVGMWENTVQIFRVNAPAPSVLEAIISDGLQEIQIRFTIGIVVTKQCSAIFTSESLEQLGFSNSSCWNSFNILTFYLQSTVKLSLNMTLIFARHNGIRTFCPPNHIGDEIEGIVNIKLPQRKIKPTLFLQGPQQVCTGVFQLRVSPIIGGGAFGLKYSWSVTSSPAVNLSVFHDILYYKRNVVDIPVEMLQPEVQYVFSVFGENVLGVMSDIYYHTVVRKNLHQLAVSIAGLVEADPSQDNMYKAEIDQCDEDVFPISFYWHVNSSDFSLPTISSRFLRILRYDMKGNKFYELDVAVFDERKQILMGRSSIVIRTKEIQLVTSTRIKFLTIGYKQPFCLNGSYFDDPSKENTTMFYQWMCFLDNGLPCYITQEDGGILRLEQVIGDDVFSRELCIKDGLPQLQNYNFTLLVKKDTRSASSSIFVKVIDGDDIPPFTLLDIAYVNNLVDLDTDLKLYYLPDTDESKCSRRPGSGLDCIYFKKWKLTYSPDNYGNISRFKLLADELSTGDSGILKYGEGKYLDIFFVFNLTSAAPPFIGILKVTPYKGFGLVTDFTLDASEGWLTNIDRYPLTYQFFYVIHGNSRYFPIEIDISFFSGLARNIILPCGTNQVIVKVCDVFGLCSNKAQRVNVLCKKPVTYQEISSFDKLLMFGHCHRAFSLIDNMKEVLTEMDELQLENTVMTQIEDCFLKNIKWYQNIYFNNSHRDEKEEERIQSLNVLPMDNFTKQEKVEMLVFKDAIFQSIKKMESEHNYEKGQQIAHIIPQKAIGLIEEAVHQLQWDFGDTNTGLENDGLRVTDKSDYMNENYHFYLLQLYNYLFESTIHYSRNAGNYLMSAVWKSTIEEYETNKFREGVEYEIMWHFIDSPELRNFDLPRANIISKGTCQALPLSTLNSFFHLQPERGKSSTDNQENVEFYWSLENPHSLYVSMKVSTYPNDMICFSIRYFTLKAAMYFFPRSDSELVSEVVSVIPRYLGNKNVIWTEEFQMNISFPIKENLKNCKCSRWNGKVWEDYEINVFPLIMGDVTCMITSLGFYGIFTHKKSSINKEFTQEDWNTLKHYNDTTPIRVQMTMFSLNGQMRKQQGFINHIRIQLAANIGVHARRIDNVRLLKTQTISHVKKDGTFVALSCGCGGLVLLLICLFVVIKRYKRSKSKVVPATCPLTNEKENNGVHVD